MDERVVSLTLEVDAGFGDVSGQAFEFVPGYGFVCLLLRVGLADGETVGSGPGAGVFDVVVAGHVFGDDCDIVAVVSC